MALFPPENAIAYAQFQLRGGWRKTVPLLAGFTLVVSVAILLSIQFNPKYRTDVLFGWTTALLIVQGLLLVLYGCNRITASIRQDLSGRMIESHRLMPMPGAHAVAGYIMGSVSQGVMLAVITFLIGTFTAAGAGIAFERWVMSNAILASFAVFLWCISCLAGFLPKGAGGITWFLIMIPMFGEGGALSLLPGLTVLLSPLIGPSIFTMRGSYSLPWTYAASFAVQIYFALICLVGATRKYQRVDAEALGVNLGLALLFGWAAVSWVGIRQWDEFRPSWLRGGLSADGQLLASMIAAMLVSIIPISATAAASIRWRRHVTLNDPAPLARPAPWPLIVLVCSALVVAISYAPLKRPDWQNAAALRSAIIVAASAASIFFLCRWLYRAGVKATWAVGFWIFLTWLVPLLGDLVRYAFSDQSASDSAVSAISGCGALGALLIIWMREHANVDIGIGVQIAIAFVPLILDLLTRPRSLPAPSLILGTSPDRPATGAAQ